MVGFPGAYWGMGSTAVSTSTRFSGAMSIRGAEVPDRQAAAGVALMLAASAALLFLAWLSIPVPLVKNTVQTELLYVQV